MNPLFEQFGKPEQLNFFDKIEELKKTIKNPRAEVEKLIQSGAMSREQFSQFGQIADQMLKR